MASCGIEQLNKTSHLPLTVGLEFNVIPLFVHIENNINIHVLFLSVYDSFVIILKNIDFCKLFKCLTENFTW